MPSPRRAVPAPIVFSHGNSFPAGTYRRLFEVWRAAGHTVHAIDRLGHNPRFPVTSNWPHLRDELIAFIESLAIGPALLVGHSLGGMVSLLVAARRPDLALGVVLIDAPVVAGWRAHSLHMAKLSGLMRRISPGRVSRARRHRWPDREAVRMHFAAKPTFARWDPRVLADYVDAGFEARNGEVVLAFDRSIETRIYDTLPHHLAQVLARHPLQCPLAYVGGTRSAEAHRAGLGATRRLAGERFELIAGTHLLPMEHPQETADAVLRLLATMRSTPKAPRRRRSGV